MTRLSTVARWFPVFAAFVGVMLTATANRHDRPVGQSRQRTTSLGFYKLLPTASESVSSTSSPPLKLIPTNAPEPAQEAAS